MNNHTGTAISKLLSRLLLTALLFLLPGLLFGEPISIRINGQLHRRVDESTLARWGRERPLGDSIVQSLSLEELLPIFSSLDTFVVRPGGLFTPDITIEPGKEESVLPLYQSWLAAGKDGKLLFMDPEGRVMEDVQEIVLSGELLAGGELEIWIAWEGVRELKEEMARWEELHGVPLRVNEVPKSDSKLLSVLRGGGEVPDIIMIQSDYLPSLTTAGALQPMVRFPTRGFSEKGRDAFSREGKLWAVPFYFDAQILFYRSDIMKDPSSGGTWNLKAFERAAEAVKTRGISPASWNAYSAYWLLPFQIGFGKRPLADASGAISVNDPATTGAVTYLKDLADRGLLDLRERDSMFSRFISGDVAMMLSASFSIPELERLGVPFGIAPFPDGPAAPVSPLLDFKGFAVTRKTRNPILARRFLLSMSDPALQHSFTSRVFKLPVTEEAWRLSARDNPYYQVLRSSYERGTVVPPSKGYNVYKNTMWKMLRFFLTGQMPVETGLEKAQQLIDNNLK